MQLSRGRLILLAGLAIPYLAFVAWYHCPYAAGSDSSGYLNSAKLLLEGRFSTPVRAPDGLTAEIFPRVYLYPIGFRLDATEQNLLPTYPIGLPLHYAAAGGFLGFESGARLVGVVSALAFAILLYLTAREFGVTPDWSAASAVVTAISPLTLQFALQTMSDLVAAVWALAAILCALRSSRHAGWAAGAGAALAMAVLVRPSNLLLLIPVAVALQPQWRTWLAFALGGLPGALFQAGYNQALYGSFLTSGYGDVSSWFALRYVPRTVWHYLVWLPVLATPFVVAAAALPWVKVDRRKKLTLLAWAGSFLLFYVGYEFTYEAWWYLRFILPALPALVIAAALGLQQFVAAVRTARLPVLAGLFVVAVGWMLAWDRSLHIWQAEPNQRAYPLVGRWLTEQAPPNAFIAATEASGAVLFYSGLPLINPLNLGPDDHARFSAWLEQRHRPLYAVLFDSEEENVFQRMPGRWERVVRIRQATVWRRLGPGETPASP